MKSNINREDTDAKKKYVFFSDPDVIVRRAESTAAASQALQNFKIHEQQRRGDPKLSQSGPETSAGTINPQTKSDLKGLETLLSYHPVQPYPFTFITAVKRKLALSMHAEACKRAYEPEKLEKPEIDTDGNRSNADFKRSINQAAQMSDFIKPLKVPDLKISPKTLDYSPRESLAAKDIVQPAGSLSSKKFDIHAIDDGALASNKSPKSCEKVHRKLDFSLLEGSPIKSCENIEPLKAPDLCIGSSLSKKKEHARDSSREKENRSKRIKKDDSGLKETPRRSKSSKHISRKDFEEESDSIFEMFKPENFLSNPPRESDFGFKKPKSKNFLTSTVKKNDDKKHRSISTQSARSGHERSSETKNKSNENDSNSEKSVKIHERITTREGFRGKQLNESVEQLHRISNQDLGTRRECEENHKHKNSEPSSSKHQKHSGKSVSQGQTKQFENYPKITQIKKSHEKQKASVSEPETKDQLTTTSEISEEIKTASGSIPSLKNAENLCKTDETDDSLRNERLKCAAASPEGEQSCRNSQSSIQTEKFHDNPEDVMNSESLPSQGTNTDSRMVETSMNQVDISTSSSQNKSDPDYKNSQTKSLSLDPTRISFRDENYDEQSEFCDLVTPDINLIPRSKRRKNFGERENNETDSRSPKHQPANTVQSKDEGIRLLHPTALHMQFQAELHLLDSFNESLRQVMDVENCLYTATHEQDKEFLLKQKENEIRRKNLSLMQTAGRDTVDIERHQIKNLQETTKRNDFAPPRTNEEDGADVQAVNTVNDNPSKGSSRVKQSQSTIGDSDYVSRQNDRVSVRVTEVQTQTANDIATQTETPRVRRRHNSPGRQVPGITYQRGSSPIEEIPQLSLESFDRLEDFDQIENVSLPSRMHTMSEISLHETTSSIRTETGTEISISTRDVTCSFNKYLDSELAQLIKDEKQRYDEIEMLFKSREKTLNDRTKKLVKLEEQKRALRDMGQDSRISSVKKKQRALLLKLQQEKDEMNRLKELHKKASQERKLMLQKQRNMLNPQMSTKNILTKLKRSADSQSPRRLSGPMKGYDIRSPSSMSSLVDSDKSQLDRSHVSETKTSVSNVKLHKSEGRIARSDIIASTQEGHDSNKSVKTDEFDNVTEQSDISLIDSHLSPESLKFIIKQQKIQNAIEKSDGKSKYEAKVCKYKETMPKIDVSYHKAHGTDLESNISSKKSIKSDTLASSEKSKTQKPVQGDLDKSISENVRSESDTLVDEFSKKSRSSQATEINFDHLKLKREKETSIDKNVFDSENLNTESDSIAEELSSKKSKSSQAMEDVSEMSSKNMRKVQNSSIAGKESCKKSQSNAKTKSNSKRKGSRSVKSKSSSDVLSENILRSKSSSQISEEIMKHHSKRSKIEKEEEAQSEENYENSFVQDNESQSSLHALVEHSRAVKEKNYQLLRNIADEHGAKEDISTKDLENLKTASARQEGSLQNVGNMSTRSQVSTLTISHHSSGESEKSYSRSVVIRAQDHHFRTTKKLEQILTAREAALASRRNCVEEWIAWHSRLRAEESRVARMEEAAFELVSAASNALPYHDTTVSSDTSDVENRIEILAGKLAERRTEMARLKREAKRQAKQRLKALETNLLNQIKKYDTTIHEMRKKLENKRGTLLNDGSSEKLAIESKSLTDFKIPDIPIKRIKEIYKNSDLLKSRSESELKSLISESKEQNDSDNVYRSENSEHDNTSYRKSPRSTASDVTDRSEIPNSDKKATTQSIQSIFEDAKSTESREPDFISENIESRSISEQIEASNYTSNARSSDKSEDKISNISFKSKSDKGRSEIDDERSKPKAASKESIISEESRASLNPESDCSSENICSVREAESESIKTVPEIPKLSKSYDISVQESTSKFVSSEVLSETELRDSGSIMEEDPSTHAISYAVEDEEITKPENHEPDLSKSVSPKTLDSEVRSEASALEIHHVQESTKHSVSASDALKTLSDDASAIATEKSSTIDETGVEKSAQKSQSISNKLSFLELGHKNLNDDISTLENDLKALSEMMSQFSKKSDGKLRSEIISEHNDDGENKGTSEDITEFDYANDIVDQEDLLNSKNNATYVVEEEEEEEYDNSELKEKDLTALKVTEIMLKIMPENGATSSSSPDLNQEIDFKARSREILNEIEKSIISEHVKSPDSSKDANLKNIERNISCLENKNEKAIDDLNSLENDIKSIAEIISHASEAKKDIRMIKSFAHDRLFEDEEAVEVSSNLHDTVTSEEPEIISSPAEKESLKVPLLNLEDKSNEEEEEDLLQSPDELTQSLQSLNRNSEDIDTQNVTRNLAEPSSTILEQTDIMFETIKDPEYEDISEESLEVSEIMDRSESQRSNNKQLHKKSNRLPEKYQTTQKSEDVLRILDEITQKSNNSALRSQQFLLTPDNHGKKIDELLQRSERLSQNFEALTKKSDTAFNVPISSPQTSSERSVLQTEIISQRSEEEFILPQSIHPTSDLSREVEKQKPTNISQDFEIPMLSDATIEADIPTDDIAVKNQSSNFVSSSNELVKHLITHEEEDSHLPSLGSVATSLDEASEKSDDLSLHTDVQRQNSAELIQGSEIFTKRVLDTAECDETLGTADPQSENQLKEDPNKSQIFDSEISDIGRSASPENLSRSKLPEEDSVRQLEEELEDEESQKSDEGSSKSDESVKNSEEILRTDEVEMLSKYQETDEASKNLIESDATNDLRADEIESKSDQELKNSNIYSYNVDIHGTEHVNLMPRSEFEEESHTVNDIKNSNESEELNAKIGHVDEATDPFEEDVSKRNEEMQDAADLSRELGAVSPKSEDLSSKINVSEKSDSGSQKSDESQGSEKSEDISQKYEVEPPSESSEEIETPRSVSEIEMDSPRDPNDSRLDIDGLDDDLLANDNNFDTQNVELRTEFHATPAVVTSEKDIEAMIDKLKVSLEQPGLDVAELEAKLLRIQQLQIELEIKKLEAEEVSYYVREIPNKPPPPYTPPSGGRLSVSQTSPSPPPAVVPTNVEDLTSFTERATHLIYQAKQSGDDITNLEPPIEICELSKDNNETARRDRKIYNTFLFDLCKETVSEVYQSEYEKPGPSWLKPNAKTKPTMKIPKTVDDLNDYVSKEVATLFGFKTKLQRENLVMRWSRKRRDRVDELLAREAQAEEDEWTKFHHDELAVKNELTTAILDSLILDAANVVKLAYIKKRKVTS